jgi:hypothetical protein
MTTPEQIETLKLDNNYVCVRNEAGVSTSSIFPQRLIHQQNIINTAPYEHALLIFIIKTLYFNGTGSIGVHDRTSFVTSFPEKVPLYQEPELPIPMVALVSTAVSLV